ncbi:MAG: hypothetical protein BalsKO_05650 [Balneolaceae bacterium]
MEYKRRNPLVAAFLSFIQPGLGQFYNGELKKSLLFFIAPFLVVLFFYFSPIISIVWGFYVALSASLIIRIVSSIESFYSASKKENYELKKINSLSYYLIILFGWGFLSGVLIDSLKDISRYKSYKIPSAVMKNTLLTGDFLIADDKFYINNEINYGDIVLFYPPHIKNSPWIQRVVAQEGDSIEIINGTFFLNGVDTSFTNTKTRLRPSVLDPSFNDPQIFNGKGNTDNFGPYRVPKNQVFLLGDNRDNSFDSRYFGFVDKNQIFGKPLYIWMSFNEALIPRFDRTMKLIE